MATIWDADVLIWAASQIVEARDAGLRPSRLMAATPYEMPPLSSPPSRCRLRNVEAWNVALADKPGRLKLLTPVKLNKIPGRSFACISDLDGAFRREDVGFLNVLEQQTDCLTIDDFCEAKRLARVDFLRCDVEGAEEKVLNGARRSIERQSPVFLNS